MMSEEFLKNEHAGNFLGKIDEQVLDVGSGVLGNRIKALLTLRNISQVDIAKKYGIFASDLCKVISGKRKTPRIRKIIAQELGVPVHVLFAHEWSRQE